MEFHDKQAIYLQIADLICENILSGKWKEGERIPSVRETAGEIEVNPNTVMRSYAYLEEKNIIFNKRGIGFFIAEDGRSVTMRMKRDNFLNDYLPDFFKNIDLLDIEMKEINQMYNQQHTQ